MTMGVCGKDFAMECRLARLGGSCKKKVQKGSEQKPSPTLPAVSSELEHRGAARSLS